MAKQAIKHIRISKDLQVCAHLNVFKEISTVVLTKITPSVGILPDYRHLYNQEFDNVTMLIAALDKVTMSIEEVLLSDVMIHPTTLLDELSKVDAVAVDNWIYDVENHNNMVCNIRDNCLYLHNRVEGWVIKIPDGKWALVNSIELMSPPRNTTRDAKLKELMA